MSFIPSVRNFYNSKLFFSKSELSKILSCYSLGVSKGSWRDYAIFFDNHEATFYMFKHSFSSPECILTKSTGSKKNKFFFKLELVNKKKNKFNQIDDLLVLLKRKQFKII